MSKPALKKVEQILVVPPEERIFPNGGKLLHVFPNGDMQVEEFPTAEVWWLVIYNHDCTTRKVVAEIND